MVYTSAMRSAALHASAPSDTREACMQCTVRCHEVHKVWSHDSFAACAQCTSACNSAYNLPFFFKYVTVFMESSYYKPAMEVPFGFAQMHIADTICHAELEGPNGKLWFVKLKRRQNECLLVHGWKEFAANYALARGDALLFQLMTNTGATKCHLAVKIFKQSPSITPTPHDSPDVCIPLDMHLVQDKVGGIKKSPSIERGSDDANLTERRTFDAGQAFEREIACNAEVRTPVNLHLIESKKELVEPPCMTCLDTHYTIDTPCINASGPLIGIEIPPHGEACKPVNLHLFDSDGESVKPLGMNLSMPYVDSSDSSKRQKNHANMHDPIKPDVLLMAETYVKRKAAVQAMAKISNCVNGSMFTQIKEMENQKLGKKSMGKSSQEKKITQGAPCTDSFLHESLIGNEVKPYPSFSKTMVATNVCTPFVVNIPTRFSDTHMAHTMRQQSYDMRLALQQSYDNVKDKRPGMVERSWRVRCSHNCVGVAKLNTGWKEFACINKLEIGDVCKFELVEPLTFIVHIRQHVKEESQEGVTPPPLFMPPDTKLQIPGLRIECTKAYT